MMHYTQKVRSTEIGTYYLKYCGALHLASFCLLFYYKYPPAGEAGFTTLPLSDSKRSDG